MGIYTEGSYLIGTLSKNKYLYDKVKAFKLAHQLDNEFEKLLFTIKNAHTIDLDDRAKTPAFWKKSWYNKTMKQLNLSKMSAENKLIYELTWARIAATAMQDEIDVKKRDVEKNTETVQNLLEINKLTIEEIANVVKVSVDFVLEVQAKMSENSSI